MPAAQIFYVCKQIVSVLNITTCIVLVDFVVVTEGGITKRSKRGKILREEEKSKEIMDRINKITVSGVL